VQNNGIATLCFPSLRLTVCNWSHRLDPGLHRNSKVIPRKSYLFGASSSKI